MKRMSALLAVAVLGVALSGCAGSLGGKSPPDEFAIVTKAPLTMPPDYALKPPRPGESRPQEKSPSERAQQLILGDTNATPPTEGELALIQSAGALNVDPNIRSILGAENGGWTEKEASLANRVIFWRVKDGQIDDAEAPLKVDNPEEWLAGRRRSIESITSSENVQISKDKKILNLPGVR